MHIVETDVLLQFIEELTVKITEGGECAYIHCWVYILTLASVIVIRVDMEELARLSVLC